ncbi:hypothetical protein RHGRI_006841 [Rhododendron griersonianum]|uniref:Uncharacterized protein n=1 Tax=Rhododendron griersonianum TaxID=479676 RepID=A0AAV6KW98_9ERIC|nr:hypothetical protein RHGRI_006841 [Rhododendron griersonianum]
MARAMATRCFCPPDNCTPRSPTMVSVLTCCNPLMKLWAFANSDAARISASVAFPSFPYAMLARIVSLNRNGSWLTRPICCLNHFNWSL